jgi:hypothetical protein
MPTLSLRGVALAIASSRTLRAKVLLCEFECGLTPSFSQCVIAVNAENDRETDGYSAIDYIS